MTKAEAGKLGGQAGKAKQIGEAGRASLAKNLEKARAAKAKKREWNPSEAGERKILDSEQ